MTFDINIFSGEAFQKAWLKNAPDIINFYLSRDVNESVYNRVGGFVTLVVKDRLSHE